MARAESTFVGPVLVGVNEQIILTHYRAHRTDPRLLNLRKPSVATALFTITASKTPGRFEPNS